MKPPLASKSKPDSTTTLNITVSMMLLAVHATSDKAQGFLPQICVVLMAVLLKLYYSHTCKEPIPKLGGRCPFKGGVLSRDYGIWNSQFPQVIYTLVKEHHP